MNFQEILVSLDIIVRKEITRFMRIWSQTLLPPVITQSLYFIVFGTFIGSQIAPVDGVPYIAFIVPGLVMMSIITSAFTNVVSSFFGSKFQKNIEEILVSPTPSWVVVLGFTLGGVVRGLLIGLIVYMVSAVFAFVPPQNLPVVLLFALLTSVIFSLAGFTNGLFAKKFDDVSIFPTFVLTPLTYLGGVFYSIDRLPDFWRNISMFNPVVYMIDGFRFGFYGVSDFNPWISLTTLFAVAVLLFAINWYYLNRGIGLKK